LGSGGAFGIAAVAGWLGLLALGLWGMARGAARPRLAIGVVLLGQFTLHLIYGDEPFTYAAHYVPLLVVLAAFASATPARWIALGLAAVVVIAGGVNNVAMFKEASAKLLSQTARGEVRRAMSERPHDPWPRGRGHVPLGFPGAVERDKAYSELGASFSPAVASFGVSIWVADGSGHLLATGDTLPLANIRQRFQWGDSLIPSLVTETPYYHATWTLVSPGDWQLVLAPRGGAGHRLAVAVRSVGPAGGPITSLSLRDGKLWINDRWQLEATPKLDLAYLGEEGVESWTEPSSGGTDANVSNGWGHARLWADSESGLTVDIRDMASPPSSGPLASLRVGSGLQLDLPDRRFVDALEAQVA
jgi:hypothetical protein